MLEILLSPKVAQCAINLTMGCTAGSLTACRLRTSCYTKLFLINIPIFLFFFNGNIYISKNNTLICMFSFSRGVKPRSTAILLCPKVQFLYLIKLPFENRSSVIFQIFNSFFIKWKHLYVLVVNDS